MSFDSRREAYQRQATRGHKQASPSYCFVKAYQNITEAWSNLNECRGIAPAAVDARIGGYISGLEDMMFDIAPYAMSREEYINMTGEEPPG